MTGSPHLETILGTVLHRWLLLCIFKKDPLHSNETNLIEAGIIISFIRLSIDELIAK